MKNAILSAMRQQQRRISQLFEEIPIERRELPMEPSFWRPADAALHLWAWQIRTNQRALAALEKREPLYPDWYRGEDEPVDETNLRIFNLYKHFTWEQALENWGAGYARLLDTGSQLTERELLDSDLFPWMNGYSIADVFLATYAHHAEHEESLRAWLADLKA